MDDLISRQAAIDAFYIQADDDGWWTGTVQDMEEFLKGLPSVQPKIGRWILGICDNCGYEWGKDAPIANVPNYCPNCGEKMSKGEEDETN